MKFVHYLIDRTETRVGTFTMVLTGVCLGNDDYIAAAVVVVVGVLLELALKVIAGAP